MVSPPQQRRLATVYDTGRKNVAEILIVRRCWEMANFNLMPQQSVK